MVTTPKASRVMLTGACSPAMACSPSRAGRLPRSSHHTVNTAASARISTPQSNRFSQCRILRIPV